MFREIKLFRLFGSALIAFGFAAAPTLAQDIETQEIEGRLDAIEHALTPYVLPESGPFRADEIAIKNNDIISMWATSPHADAQSEAFTHWDEDGEIDEACANCHSGAGFRDFHGLDGTAPGVQGPTPTGGVIDCATCHNPGLATVTVVKLPSNVLHPVSPIEAACMTCHSGRRAGTAVAGAIAEKPVDEVDPELGFINPHYRLAGAIWLGTVAKGGYEYPGKSYSGRFFHARPIETCVSCHDAHTLKVNEEVCSTCHLDGAPNSIRLARVSYDGSGDLSKGIRSDLEANAALLMSLIEAYSAEVAGTKLVYETRYPYFFADANQDGRADQAEGRSVAYKGWTPRLLRAAYNWKLVTSDPGAFAHNPHYAFEILYDSIEDLAVALGRDMTELGIYR